MRKCMCAALMSMAMGDILNATTLWGACPSIVPSTDMPFCIEDKNGTISTFKNDIPFVDASNRGIERITSLPSDPISLDLSMNAITNIGEYADSSKLLTLNLSRNQITQTSVLAIPPSLTALDLSYNRIKQIYRWTALNTTRPLTKINLRGNQLSMIRETKFPPTLNELDLTDNPIRVFDVDRETFAIFSRPGFVLKVDRPLAADVVTTCAGTPTLLPNSNTYLCVYDGSHEDISTMAFAFLTKYAIVVACIFLLAWAARRYLLMRMAPRLEPRDTYLSSNCANYDDIAVQYRQSLSANPPASRS